MPLRAEIDRDFFFRHVSGNADALWTEWQGWLEARKRSEGARVRWLLARLTGRKLGTVSHYVHGRRERLGPGSLAELDRVARILGREDLCSAGPRVPGPDETRRIALFTELDVPSRAFHARVTASLLREASHHGSVVSIHETDPVRLAQTVDGVVQTQPPHAAVLIRLTPTPPILEKLRDRGIPVIIVHGDRLAYPPPVIASVVPAHDSLARSLAAWIEGLPERVERPLLVTLADDSEVPVPDAWLIPGTARSLRNDRVEVIRSTLERVCGLKPSDHVRIDDFSYRRAFQVHAEHPDRDLYVVLSDEVAIALRALMAQVEPDAPVQIIGYDFSAEARDVLPSFDQGLDSIGSSVLASFAALWRPGAYPAWGDRCEEITSEVVLRTVPGI